MQTPAASPALKVFLAEDSLPVRQRIAAALSARAMKVVGEAATPAACIAGILDTHPDVVVLDIHLEGGSGLQVLQAVRASDAHVGFVVFSNSASAPYRKRYLAEGAAGFLDKGADLEELGAAVQAASHRPLHH